MCENLFFGTKTVFSFGIRTREEVEVEVEVERNGRKRRERKKKGGGIARRVLEFEVYSVKVTLRNYHCDHRTHQN